MKNKILSITNLNTGEVIGDLKQKQGDNRFVVRGLKMYATGIDYLIENLTKKELQTVNAMFDTKTIDKFNCLTLAFKDVTLYYDKSDRSKYKKKLIELRIILDYNKKIMLNPFIFNPIGDKNILNCNYLTQQVWKYLVEDCNNYSDEIENHVNIIFGTRG